LAGPSGACKTRRLLKNLDAAKLGMRFFLLHSLAAAERAGRRRLVKTSVRPQTDPFQLSSAVAELGGVRVAPHPYGRVCKPAVLICAPIRPRSGDPYNGIGYRTTTNHIPPAGRSRRRFRPRRGAGKTALRGEFGSPSRRNSTRRTRIRVWSAAAPPIRHHAHDPTTAH